MSGGTIGPGPYPPDFNPARTVTFRNDRQDREHTRLTVTHELAHLALMHPGTGEDICEREAGIIPITVVSMSMVTLWASSGRSASFRLK
ncbi:hypothetical protein HMPREF2826_00760 [Olsenella sp. HMSC062G07]|nr:hypothetical protein HMPREF2826_00760 [Olsenella sp. HMSC062G07]